MAKTVLNTAATSQSGRQYVTMADFVKGKYRKTCANTATGMIRSIRWHDVSVNFDLDDNTVILFLTDNGYSLGAHDMSGKVSHEEPSRTPMIMFDPRVKSWVRTTASKRHE